MPDGASFGRRHRLSLAVLGLALMALLAAGAWWAAKEQRSQEFQDALQPFYTPPQPLPAGSPGDLIRQEPLPAAVSGGRGWRVLYLSERADGGATVSSAMIFVPDTAATGPRPVVAWAHGTVGMGSSCAPSRRADPLADMDWLELMLSRGWVVTATDYTGLGTPGVEPFLLGRDEARDVLNAVRAARRLPESSAGEGFAVWGHSQGGHAALFTAQEAAGYAPELRLVAAAAAAPAAELAPLIAEQYQSEVGWVIGPEVLVAWPTVYPDLDPQSVVTPQGLKSYRQLAEDCITTDAEVALLRHTLKENFFQVNPVTLASWYQAAEWETPQAPPTTRPLFIAQGLADTVVLPDTTARLIERACHGGADLTTLWLGDTNHMTTAAVAGPAVVDWLADRFAGKPTNPSCGQPLPVAPAAP